MKRILPFILLLFAFSVAITPSKAQCSADDCSNKLINGYVFIKSYHMNMADSEVEFSYAFSKDTNYMLLTCLNSVSNGNYVLSLLDANKHVVATNYDESTQKYYSEISFNCKSTGIYYLKYSFKENPTCGICILGIKD